MASKGSPIVPIRVPQDLLDQVDALIESSMANRRAGPWTRSSFILAAIQEKVSHLGRSGNTRIRPRVKLAQVNPTVSAQAPIPDQGVLHPQAETLSQGNS